MLKRGATILIALLLLVDVSVQIAKKMKGKRENKCPYDKYCLSCNSEKRCGRCVSTWVDKTGICQRPAVEIPGCSLYSSDMSCDTCMKGFYLISNNRCEPITLPNCAILVAGSLTSCSVCNNGTQPNSAGQCTDVPCSVTNCQLCGVAGANACRGCKPGFSLTTSGTCVTEPSKYCLLADGKDCLYCNDGYYHTKKKCLWSVVQNVPQSAGMLSAVAAIMLAVHALL